jgi:TolB-like protein/DNA-binding winged helix-turn-helix (wHTH) protein/Tfp pilus assembly protein PilF
MPSGDKEGALQIGEWIVNPSLDSISKGTETQKLEPRTMRLLLCLADSAGEVVSVDRLLNEVWTGVVVGSASVYQAVSQLRKLLGDVDAEPTYIATVPRKGYRLIAPVKRLERSRGITAPIEIAHPEETPSAVDVTPPRARKRLLLPLALGAALVVALILISVVWKKSATVKVTAAAANSIVVLPFVDMTADKSDQSFCDGLTEELSSWLAQIPTLRVVARTSAFAFRGQAEDVRQIGKALDINHILEGSMRRSGDHMRITVQLIDAQTGFHLWSENFDRPVADAIKIQEDISRAVAQSLKVRMTSESERRMLARLTSDPQAYQLYLLGRHFSQQITVESQERAIELYQQVIAADPNFAPAYTQLAYARLNQGYFRDTPIADVASQIEPIIDTALRLDDRMSSAYGVRGALRAAQLRTKEALSDLKLAISLNPSDMGALAEIGRIQLFSGEPRDALKSYDQAAALDPLNSQLQEQRCTVLDDLALYEAATAACDRARVLDPGLASPADRFTWLAASRGRVDEALRWNSKAIKDAPDEFEYYWTRANLLLSVGLGESARVAVEQGRAATKSDDSANVAIVRVIFCQKGTGALRDYLRSAKLEQSSHAFALFEAAYARLLLGEAAEAKELIARALNAHDLIPGFADGPFWLRGEIATSASYRIDLASAEIELEDRESAQRELSVVLGTLDNMIAAGVERSATFELRARVLALKGRGDDAMKDLAKAAQLGWRRAWWAMHEPYFASLRTRKDFRDLIAETNRSNDQLIEKIKLLQ